MVSTATGVLVVGSGPAGLAVAIGARLRGLEVTVLDRAESPIDKPCGEGLMPDGVALLAELGVDPEAEGRPFRGIRYLDGDLVAGADFPGAPGLGLRRTRLHRAMTARARELGVRLEWGLTVRGLTPRGVVTAEGEIEAQWIVGADGLRSAVRKWSGLEGRAARRLRFGVRRHFAIAPWSERVEVYWADGCEAYVTPVAPDEVGVALLWSGGKADFDSLIFRFPALREHLAGARETSRDRGTGPLDQRPRGVSRGRVALVGDAAGYRDAITGEGISLALHQARALVECLAAGSLAGYPRQVKRITRVPNALIEALLLVEKRPALRRRLVRTLAADPDLFRRLLAVHVREASPRSLGLGGAWRLARGLLPGG